MCVYTHIHTVIGFSKTPSNSIGKGKLLVFLVGAGVTGLSVWETDIDAFTQLHNLFKMDHRLKCEGQNNLEHNIFMTLGAGKEISLVHKRH